MVILLDSVQWTPWLPHNESKHLVKEDHGINKPKEQVRIENLGSTELDGGEKLPMLSPFAGSA